jgi:eukaryotic-like serine/threonine-protein kinase
VTLTIKGGRLDGSEYVLDEPRTYLIGRAEGCDVRLPDDLVFRDVSRRHCVLAVDPAGVRVRDCGSRNGTLINGMQIGFPVHWWVPPDGPPATFRHYALRPGDELRVGHVVFGLRVDPLPDSSEGRAELELVCPAGRPGDAGAA